jgi:23S rRNA pseudouridine2457 synthase
MLIAFHKPFGVLSQFTSDGSSNRTLAQFGFPKNVYPIGRLDADSEGLLLLSDEGELNERLLHPRHAHEREYWAQVERIPATGALQKLSRGVIIQGRKTLPCRAWLLEPQPEVESTPAFGRDAFHRVPNSTKKVADAVERVPAVIPPRDPPIRFRKTVPTCWIGLELVEGKNRQVRRMTAAIGHPTLRLVRVQIGGLRLGNLPAGKWKELSREENRTILQ